MGSRDEDADSEMRLKYLGMETKAGLLPPTPQEAQPGLGHWGHPPDCLVALNLLLSLYCQCF